MFEFFERVIDFFSGIGKIVNMMWDAVTQAFEAVGTFFSDVFSPIVQFLPHILGNSLGITIEVIILLLIGLAIWEAIN